VRRDVAESCIMVRLLLFHAAWGLLLALLGLATRMARWLDDPRDSLRTDEQADCRVESSKKSLGPPHCWPVRACMLCVVSIRYAQVRSDSVVNVLIEGTGAVLPVAGRRGINFVDGEGRKGCRCYVLRRGSEGLK
jgi:hypothetical protein